MIKLYCVKNKINYHLSSGTPFIVDTPISYDYTIDKIYYAIFETKDYYGVMSDYGAGLMIPKSCYMFFIEKEYRKLKLKKLNLL